MTDLQPIPEKQSQNTGNPKFCWIARKHQIPRQERIWIHRNKKSQKASCPLTNPPIPKLSMKSMVWDISIGQGGHLFGCALSQLLRTCSLGECEKLEKVPDFIATTENTSVINIPLVLNPKHSSYWEEN